MCVCVCVTDCVCEYFFKKSKPCLLCYSIMNVFKVSWYGRWYFVEFEKFKENTPTYGFLRIDRKFCKFALVTSIK